MISLKQFSCGYPKRPVLTNINLEIASGKITVVIGQNGSGKSTLAQVLAGLKMDFCGEVWLDSLQLKRHVAVRDLRQKVGLVLQNPDHQILFDSVADEIGFALQNLKLPEITDLPKTRRERERIIHARRNKIVQQVLAQVKLSDEVSTNPQTLSGGQKQRLALASVLAMRPEYLILDEATSMLDLPSRRAVYQILEDLKNQGIGIIMMTNSLDEILLADTVLILDNSKLIALTPDEIIKTPTLLTGHGLDVPLILQVAQKLKVSKLDELRRKI